MRSKLANKDRRIAKDQQYLFYKSGQKVNKQLEQGEGSYTMGKIK